MKSNRVIDLRSDTVTRPTDAMRRAMADAEVGDDVYREDPTVIRLEARVAEMLGLEAGLFMSSGTQSNLAALMSHCARGEGFISGVLYHVNAAEAGGAAVLGSLVPAPVPVEEDGTIAPDAIRAAIQPDDIHRPPTRLVSIENTVSGRVMPPGYVGDVVALARGHGLAVHLDGARLMNASVASGEAPGDIAAGVDSVSLCLSKGLGAPAGTVLAGSAGFIERARRLRKMLGGGMRQAGVLAAAGLHALDAHVDRLAEDHEIAAALGERLAEVARVRRVATNMIYAELEGGEALRRHLAERGILVARPGPSSTRVVVHRDIMAEDVGRIGDAFEAFRG